MYDFFAYFGAAIIAIIFIIALGLIIIPLFLCFFIGIVYMIFTVAPILLIIWLTIWWLSK
jgi:hypothetical protein